MFEIINANCLDAFDRFRAEGRRFDAIIADPPYCSGGFLPAQKMNKGAEKYSGYTKRLGNFNDGMTERVLIRFTEEWSRKALDCLNSPGYFFLFTDWRMAPTFVDGLLLGGVFIRGVITWDKGKSRTRPQKGQFSQTSEFILWGTRDAAKSEKFVTESVFSVPTDAPIKRIHPTQKPVGIIDELLKILPDGARSICDPFSGSASSGIAALKKGLDFIGIEKDAQFAEISRKRLEEYIRENAFLEGTEKNQ